MKAKFGFIIALTLCIIFICSCSSEVTITSTTTQIQTITQTKEVTITPQLSEEELIKEIVLNNLNDEILEALGWELSFMQVRQMDENDTRFWVFLAGRDSPIFAGHVLVDLPSKTIQNTHITPSLNVLLEEYETNAMVWEVLNAHSHTKALLDNRAIIDGELITVEMTHYVATVRIYLDDKKYSIKVDCAKEEIMEILERDSQWLNIEI
ncbi:MAG: hypothetical protein JSV74_05950 [Dehalococcoidia bacterium]|nr:MAG: hypothetical protein JSV74_05950 [Dehalococcoidia bacterium]